MRFSRFAANLSLFHFLPRPGAILGHLGAILGPSWDHPGPSWGLLGAILGHLGAFLAHPGVILGPSWAILGHPGAILGPSWGHLGPSWAILGPSWGQLGPSWPGPPQDGQYGPKKAGANLWGKFFLVWGQPVGEVFWLLFWRPWTSNNLVFPDEK